MSRLTLGLAVAGSLFAVTARAQTQAEIADRENEEGKELMFANKMAEASAKFQSAVARTDFVLGEFPWRVRVGDTIEVDDYIAPPHVLSSEGTDEETTWSHGVYTDATRIWKAFSVPARG